MSILDGMVGEAGEFRRHVFSFLSRAAGLSFACVFGMPAGAFAVAVGVPSSARVLLVHRRAALPSIVFAFDLFLVFFRVSACIWFSCLWALSGGFGGLCACICIFAQICRPL